MNIITSDKYWGNFKIIMLFPFADIWFFNMKLKLSAIQILVTGLQAGEMGAIYLMGTGIKEMPDTVTKANLTNIITFLCGQLDWIGNDEEENIELSANVMN